MRHIALSSYDAPPCNGEIHFIPIASPIGASHFEASSHRSLPILGQRPAVDQAPAGEWVCAGCGHKWAREPLPQDAL